MPVEYCSGSEFNDAQEKKQATAPQGAEKRLVRSLFATALGTIAIVNVFLAELDLPALPTIPGIVETTPQLPQESVDVPDVTVATVPGDITEETVPPTESVAFPALPNMDPDISGGFAWADSGSEEYVRLMQGGQDTFLHCGGFYRDRGVVTSTPAGMYYDLGANTLTLQNYAGGGILDVNLMGNGFTVCLVGENRLDGIRVWGAMYGGSITFTGQGSLTVASGGVGLLLECEQSPSCIMVDSGVTLDISGAAAAVVVRDSTLERTLYFRTAITPNILGEVTSSDEYGIPATALADGDGNILNHVIFGRG